MQSRSPQAASPAAGDVSLPASSSPPAFSSTTSQTCTSSTTSFLSASDTALSSMSCSSSSTSLTSSSTASGSPSSPSLVPSCPEPAGALSNTSCSGLSLAHRSQPLGSAATPSLLSTVPGDHPASSGIPESEPESLSRLPLAFQTDSRSPEPPSDPSSAQNGGAANSEIQEGVPGEGDSSFSATATNQAPVPRKKSKLYVPGKTDTLK